MPRTVYAGLAALLFLGGTSAVRTQSSAARPSGPGKGGAAVADPSLARFEVEALATDVALGSHLPLRAVGVGPGGERRNVTLQVTWKVEPPTRGQVDGLSRFVAREPGPARVIAVLDGRRSTPLPVTVLAQGRPDWDVIMIQRHPRTPIDEAQPQPEAPARVQWVAHVKNYGTADAPPVAVEWRVDGKTIRRGKLPKLERFAQTELVFGQPEPAEDGGPRTFELVVDPQNEVPETCEGNNSLAIHSDALSVGFWVEESVLRYFHQHQHELNAGSNSWEDWAQRQIAFWNNPPQEAGHEAGEADAGEAAANNPEVPSAPTQPARPRWRLDRIVVVRDGLLPLAGANAETEPDRRDRTLHFVRGFPAALLQPATGDGGAPRYQRTREATPENPFYVDVELLRALSQARLPKPAEPSPENAQ